MSLARSVCMLTTRMTPIQQLGNGKMSLIEWVNVMLPYKLENGKLYRFDGEEMKEFTGFEDKEDCEILPKSLFEQKVVTQTWRNNVIAKMNEFLGSATQQVEAIDGDFEEPQQDQVDQQADQQDRVDQADQVDQVDTSKLDEAIKNKSKKAKKLLKELKEVLPKEVYKEYKKQIKEMK